MNDNLPEAVFLIFRLFSWILRPPRLDAINRSGAWKRTTARFRMPVPSTCQKM